MTVRTRDDGGRLGRSPGPMPGGRAGRRAWLALGLGLVSVAAVAWALLGLSSPPNVRAIPAAEYAPLIRFYRAQSLLLGLGVVTGLAALTIARRVRPRWLRVVATLAGAAGMLGGGFLLLVAVGLCGASVLWGYCNA